MVPRGGIPYAYEERKVKTYFPVNPNFSLKGIPSFALLWTQSDRATGTFRADHLTTKAIKSGDV
ncbi:MAG: hypothetical protein JSW47_10245, partial [Phycisphaerales bacterium]